jgi:hypothetical protein
VVLVLETEVLEEGLVLSTVLQEVLVVRVTLEEVLKALLLLVLVEVEQGQLVQVLSLVLLEELEVQVYQIASVVLPSFMLVVEVEHEMVMVVQQMGQEELAVEELEQEVLEQTALGVEEVQVGLMELLESEEKVSLLFLTLSMGQVVFYLLRQEELLRLLEEIRFTLSHLTVPLLL